MGLRTSYYIEYPKDLVTVNKGDANFHNFNSSYSDSRYGYVDDTSNNDTGLFIEPISNDDDSHNAYDYYQSNHPITTLIRSPFSSSLQYKIQYGIDNTSIININIDYNRLSSNKFDFYKIKTFGCKYCRTHLSSTLEIMSRDYRGKTGKAYLMSNVVNIIEGKKEVRPMITGDYLVCDIQCQLCRQTIGWKYLMSEMLDQKFKEGKYILELKKIIKVE